MNTALTFAGRLVKVLSRLLNALAGVLLLVLMLLTVADVVSRQLFGASFLGTVDISTLLLVGIAFLGLGAAESTGKHVSVTMIHDALGPRPLLSVVRLVALLVIGSVMVGGLAEATISAYQRGETTNAILLLPTWHTKALLWLSFTVFFIIAIAKEALELRELWRGRGASSDSSRSASSDSRRGASSESPRSASSDSPRSASSQSPESGLP